MNEQTTIEAQALAFADNLKAFRSAAVTSENKGDHFARSLLAAMLATTGPLSKDMAIASIIAGFGNPNRPNGKPVDSLSQLRSFTGGDAVRKAAEAVFRIVENVDADSEGAAVIRKTVIAFILRDKAAPKSLFALSKAVTAALSAEAKRRNPDSGDAAESNEGTEGGEATPRSLADYISEATTALGVATPTEIAEAGPALFALIEAAQAAWLMLQNESGEELPLDKAA